MDTINLNSPQADPNSRNTNMPETPAGNSPVGGPAFPPPPPRNRAAGQPVPAPYRNPQRGGNDTARKVAVGVGAAVTASAATAATMSAVEAEPETELSLDDQIVEVGAQAVQAVQPPSQETPSGNGASGQGTSGGHTPSTQANEVTQPEPEPIPDPEPEPLPDPEPVVPEPDIVGEISDPEDIDAIADALIAQEQVDPDDIEEGDIFTFNGIETVYTVEGDEEVHASFTSNTGYDLVMVDIDNDGLFDKIETPDGLFVDDASQFGLTVSDAENMVQGEGYLAQTDTETERFDQEFGDDYLDDIITV